jgi:2-keto-3-deoxy-L-rhamnonate aldolase RhmA
MKSDLSGKVSLVTGSAGGIRLASADRLAANGCRVVSTELDLDQTRSAAARSRGFGPRRSPNDGRQADYLEHANGNVFVAVQINTSEALHALNAILGIPGIDSLVIGPADMAGVLHGKPGGGPSHAGTDCDHQRPGAASGGCRSVAAWGRMASSSCAWPGSGVQWLQCGRDCSLVLRGIEALYQGIRARLKSVRA